MKMQKCVPVKRANFRTIPWLCWATRWVGLILACSPTQGQSVVLGCSSLPPQLDVSSAAFLTHPESDTVDLSCTILMNDINQIRRGLHTNVHFIKCTVVIEMSCLKCDLQRSGWLNEQWGGWRQWAQGRFEQRWVVSRRFAKLQWQDTTRRRWSNTTAGWWDLERLLSSELGQQEQRSTCMCEPPNRWQGGPLPVCVRMDVSYSMYMSGCTWLSEGPISCSRLRKVPQNTEIQIVSLWWCHRLDFSARISQKRASVTFSQCTVGLHVHNFTPVSRFTGLWEEAHIKRFRCCGDSNVQYEINNRDKTLGGLSSLHASTKAQQPPFI